MQIVNRDWKESAIAKAVSKWLARFKPQFTDYIDDSAPDLEDVPKTFWNELLREGWEVIAPLLLAVLVEQAVDMSVDVGTELTATTWTTVNENAAQWSRTYGYDLITGINDTTRKQMQEIMADFYENSATMDDLTKKIAELFGPARAERIAITETTRAAVQGEKAYIEALEREHGLHATPFWHTAKDDYVCPDCSAKDGMMLARGDEPPLHPGCRCFIDWEVE